MRAIMKRGIGMVLALVLVCMIMPQSLVQAAEYDKPYVSIASYELEGGAITPGEEFELKLVLKNTSETQRIGSIMTTISSQDNVVEPVYGESDQFYLDSIGKGQSVDVSLKLLANKGVTATTAKLTFAFVYADAASTSNVNYATLHLPISTSGALNIENISVSDTATIGSKSRISATYENTGSDELSNIVLHVNGTGIGAEQTFSLETLGGGDKNYAEAYLDYLMSGEQTINISFTYEDKDGLTHETDYQSFQVMVSQNTSNFESVVPNMQGGSTSFLETNLVPIILLGAILVLLVVIIVLYRKMKQ